MELNNKGSTHLSEKEWLSSDFPLEIIGVSPVMDWRAYLLSLWEYMFLQHHLYFRVNRFLAKEKQTKSLYILENENNNQCGNRLLRKKLIINEWDIKFWLTRVST